MAMENGRTVTWLKTGWRFLYESSASGPDGFAAAFDDSAWRSVSVPHDWAITGPFDETIDVHYTAIHADGETRKRNHTGRTGGLPHVGVGWYRIHFSLDETNSAKSVRLEFDGIMSHAEVYVNGSKVGGWPYGYASFAFDITAVARAGDNVLAVRCENPPLSSRWYPGAGIYRNVRLVVMPENHVAHWGTYVTTPHVTQDQAKVRVQTRVDGVDGARVKLDTILIDPNGIEVGRVSAHGKIKNTLVLEQSLTLQNPSLWDLQDRNLYVLRSTVTGDLDTDVYETVFGFRSLIFDADSGFSLNGKRMKLNGVCMHHDLGPLGAAVNRDALIRQLESLQGMGCNAIRTSHNPPTPELLELCDEMGFLVIDEAFDEWKIAKVDNGYHTLFDEWAERDLRAMIRRDRNHPCVIMWSIGNEILEQHHENGAETARFLAAVCTDEDPTRPTTAGFNGSDAAIANGLAAEVAVPGWNYKPHLYALYKREHPNWPMYGSETESCVSSRGEYYFPPQEERDVCRETLQVTSYDVSSPSWGYPPDVEFQAQDQCPFIMGEFVWTGWDYLGEPTPYKTEWPSRSAYFGIVDLCGLPKDRYYAYKAKWTDKPTLHLFPHWTWPGREGQLTPIHCYTNHAAVELFVNGASHGVRRKEANSIAEKYRLIWDSVVYQSGEIQAVAYDGVGEPVEECVIRTAGLAHALHAVVDKPAVSLDGESMVFVTVAVVDENGTLCPDASDTVTFAVDGPAKLAAVGNGDPTSLESFQADTRDAFHGKCVGYVRITGKGTVSITCRAVNLTEAAVTVAVE